MLYRGTIKGPIARTPFVTRAVIGSRVTKLTRSRRALNVSAEQVQATIPKDGALIGYLSYEHYLGKDRFENKRTKSPSAFA